MRIEENVQRSEPDGHLTADVQRSNAGHVREAFKKFVVPSYSRFDLVLERGEGSYVWDVDGKRYLDLAAGIAVCSLGHASSEITEALTEQSQKLIHVSNLYYNELQGRLAKRIVDLIAPGRVFFCNSGAEANEGLFKLARKFGHEDGRFEIITTLNSFHGRTLAGIKATGQEKVKKGFEPIMPGFRHVPYNDLDQMREALSPATVAILIEGVQGEGGVTPAMPEYLLGRRQLCDERKLLLLMDGVQCGHFRTGRFQSFQRILEGPADAASGRAPAFLPDGFAMAKSLGGGFPIGAFWVRAPHADLLGPGTHATTFGGTPLACAVALKVLEVIQRDKLADNARAQGEFLKQSLLRLAGKYPTVLNSVRGLGLMVGFEVAPNIAALAAQGKTPSLLMANRLHDAGLLAIPAGRQILRLLPPLNLSRPEAEQGIQIIESVVEKLSR